MTQIITIHSFRRGTGKTHLVANLAAHYALSGKRVGMVDMNFYAPALHLRYGLDDEPQHHALNDFLWGKCSILQAAYDVTPCLGAKILGQAYLVPASSKLADIARTIRGPFNLDRISEGLNTLISSYSLDILILDTANGIQEESLMPMAMSDALAVVFRIDQQDFQGTAVTVDVARSLNVPKIFLVANLVPATFDLENVRGEVEGTYQAPVGAVIPYMDEVVTLPTRALFLARYPDHPVSAFLRKLAAQLAGEFSA